MLKSGKPFAGALRQTAQNFFKRTMTSEGRSSSSFRRKAAAALAFTGGLGATVAYSWPSTAHAAAPVSNKTLPILKLSDVAEHTSAESGVWVTYKGGVYDVTSFLMAHPGGTPRLLMAAGQDLEPFWNVYRQHYRGHILEFMERYRIGNLSPAEAKKAAEFEFADAYENDPTRHPDHLGCTFKPWCGEPRTWKLADAYYTPNELFYVRNHLPVPDINPEEYVLIVKGVGVKKHKFTLKQLKTMFPKHEVVSTLQCAGNRREDLHGERGIFISPHWVVGAISNAKWGGARLRDVLDYCGLDVDGLALGKINDPFIKHVQFEGYDCDETGLTYGGSIPIDKAVDGLGDCLVAYEMNNEPLPRDHGYPVRALAPGHAGARQCKWLHKIIVSSEESMKPWHQKSYRGFAPDITFEDHLSQWPRGLRLDQAPIVQEMPVQSLVCNPPPNMQLAGKGHDSITVRGVAWSGGGRGVTRVDVSIDGGKNFTAAELHKPVEQRRNRQWGWYLFEQTIPLTAEMKSQLSKGQKVNLDITSKAMNGDFNVQPERPDPFWNARGVCINHWYHVPVTIDPSAKENKHPDSDHFSNTPTGGRFNIPWKDHGWKNSDAGRHY